MINNSCWNWLWSASWHTWQHTSVFRYFRHIKWCNVLWETFHIHVIKNDAQNLTLIQLNLKKNHDNTVFLMKCSLCHTFVQFCCYQISKIDQNWDDFFFYIVILCRFVFCFLMLVIADCHSTISIFKLFCLLVCWIKSCFVYFTSTAVKKTAYPKAWNKQTKLIRYIFIGTCWVHQGGAFELRIPGCYEV